MLTLKLNDEEQAQLGISDKASLFQRVAELASVESDAKATKESNSTMKAELEALAKRVDDIEAQLVTDAADSAALRADMIAQAVAESTKACTGLLSKIGAQALPASAPLDDESTKAKIAEDDYEGQWKACPATRQEFKTQSLFEAFKRAEAAGQVRICTKTKEE